MIQLSYYMLVPVLTILHKLNRYVSIANRFNLILLYYCWCHVTLILHKPNNPLRWTVRASPKGVGRREGLLYYGFRT